MGKFERSRKPRRDSREGSPRKSRSFEDSRRERRDRGPRRGGRSRGDVEMTKVTCSSCGSKCEVPFKPTSSKPVYCDKCFAKKPRSGSGGPSSKDLEVINEKLDKIMKALKIE